MKQLLFGAALVSINFLGVVSPSSAAESICEPPRIAMMRAETSAMQAGGTAVRLAGEQAERFFDFLNDKVGRDTDYWGDSAIIVRYPALGYASVAIEDDGCVDETKMIRLDPRVAALAVAAAESSSGW